MKNVWKLALTVIAALVLGISIQFCRYRIWIYQGDFFRYDRLTAEVQYWDEGRWQKLDGENKVSPERLSK